MDINTIIAGLDVAYAVAGKQDPLQTLGDLRSLVTVYNGGKPDIAGIIKSGKVSTDLDALAWTCAVMSAVSKDPAHAGAVTTLLNAVFQPTGAT